MEASVGSSVQAGATLPAAARASLTVFPSQLESGGEILSQDMVSLVL